MDLNEIISNNTVIWFIVGLVFMVLELIAPGFVLLFFGAGAWITALCFYLYEPSLNIQLIIFFVSSVFLLIVLRRHLKLSFFKERISKDQFEAEEFIGKTAEVVKDIKTNKSGKVSFNGTLWTAKSEFELKSGEVVEIVSKESICLNVKPKNRKS